MPSTSFLPFLSPSPHLYLTPSPTPLPQTLLPLSSSSLSTCLPFTPFSSTFPTLLPPFSSAFYLLYLPSSLSPLLILSLCSSLSLPSHSCTPMDLKK
uniref:Wsv094 n=1 Tax=Macrostomum lignano TaxID=282301 RepID=A0A1I8J6L3_9PLAT